MSKRDALIYLSGQVINGMMSADGTVLAKLLDRTIHVDAAKIAVGIAEDILKEIYSDAMLR